MKNYCNVPGFGSGRRIGGSIGIRAIIKFEIKDFYVMGKRLSGELSCMWTGLVTI